jgi:hypothetical protein
MDLVPRMPLFAPLALDQVQDLMYVREKKVPRTEGRPRREAGDKIARYEQRLLLALDTLLPEVAMARQHVFALLDRLIQTGQWNRRALLDILYPAPLTAYPARLYEWRNEHFLFLDKHGDPEIQSAAAILVQRELDTRKRRLPPPRAEPRSFYCWRWDTPQRPPSSYEMPLAPAEREGGVVLKPHPKPGPLPYILTTLWKGAAWDSDAWLVVEGGALRWVGLPTEEHLAVWFSQQEMASLASSTDRIDRAKRALRLLADRLPHSSSSDTPT